MAERPATCCTHGVQCYTPLASLPFSASCFFKDLPLILASLGSRGLLIALSGTIGLLTHARRKKESNSHPRKKLKRTFACCTLCSEASGSARSHRVSQREWGDDRLYGEITHQSRIPYVALSAPIRSLRAVTWVGLSHQLAPSLMQWLAMDS